MDLDRLKDFFTILQPKNNYNISARGGCWYGCYTTLMTSSGADICGFLPWLMLVLETLWHILFLVIYLRSLLEVKHLSYEFLQIIANENQIFCLITTQHNVQLWLFEMRVEYLWLDWNVRMVEGIAWNRETIKALLLSRQEWYEKIGTTFTFIY